jgi:hypothetical protein
VAIQLIDCSRGLPQSPRLLRNDKQGAFIYRSAAPKQSSYLDRHALIPRARDDKQVFDGCRLIAAAYKHCKWPAHRSAFYLEGK